jgi:TRAP-type mannitol/chloroaromatic compound transport system substrate-binding protein
MKTKHIVGTVALVAGVFGMSAGAVAEKINWNYSIWGNPRAFTRGIETLNEFLKEKTDGNFSLTIHYGEAISPSRENLDGLSIGAFESTHLCTSYHPGKNPIGTALDLPFLPIETLEEMRDVHDAFQHFEPWKEEMKGWNALPLYAGFLPRYEFMGRGEPPRKLEDWAGKRVRALAGLGEAMRRVGSVPTSVPAPELYQALERRVIDAASFPFSYAFSAYRLHEIATWYTYNMALGSLHCPTVVNINNYNALPAEYRDLLWEGVPVAYEGLIQAYRDADEKWIPIYDERLERITFSDEDLERFRDAAAGPVWEDWVKEMEGKGLPGQKTLDFILEEAEKAHARRGS